MLLHLNESCLGVKKVDDPRNFGVAELDENGYIKSVCRKNLRSQNLILHW